jgi:hypothetical protein
MRRVMFLLAGSIILILSGCSNYEIPAQPCPEGDRTVKFSADIQPIFDKKCISCHSGNQAPDLSAGWSHDELIDGGYVEEPEFACESILYQKFSGSHSGRATDEEVLKILGWIQEGAQDN